MNRFIVALFVILASSVSVSEATEVTIEHQDVTVWSPTQTVTGKVIPPEAASGTLYINGEGQTFTVSQSDSSFSAEVMLGDGENTIVATVDSQGTPIYSDSLRLTLGYNIQPELEIVPEISGSTVDLNLHLVSNPGSVTIDFQWSEDPGNPQNLGLTSSGDSSANATIPDEAKVGEYYFDVRGVCSDGDTVRARTFVTVTPDSIYPFRIATDYAAWIDSAVVYEITPYIFEANGRFTDITARLPELADFGVTAIWIQPVMETEYGGQGYDIIDYFAVRGDLGTPGELRELVQTAKSLGLRVMFDFVANHSSIAHPYAEHSVQFGQQSHYYDFYQREFGDAPYSQHYHNHPDGFVYYFWEDLPSLNYDNPEVRKWISEAALYWIKEFDIDGYRFDAIWGVNARRPTFMQNLRRKIKRIKPEFLMLGEDKATWPESFDERFDVAYDWAPEESWVSHWTWQYNYSPGDNPTVFNHPNADARVSMLRNALTNDGNGYHPRAKIFRFMENNDTERFLPHHETRRTKMVATLLFNLDGVPMMYNGQEIGATSHPYETYRLFENGESISSQDESGLYPYYRSLISLRKGLPALQSDNFQEVTATPGDHIFAFRRWQEDQSVFCLLNMQDEYALTTLYLPMSDLNLDAEKTYYLTEQLTGQVYSGKPAELDSLNMVMLGYQAKMFVLADSVVTVETAPEPVSLPTEIMLAQNYPNPFNPATTIQYLLPEATDVTLTVYDVSGRIVETLVKKDQSQGQYTVKFNGQRYPSGMYFYRLTAAGHAQTRKMILVK
ncbi:MAG: T9SS type A sorting domain-containing protein [Candidatus Marinimicrobia bacterium]|nr:T9SS type A sorting domain-containing protein [Candidatus Neomarinimicrobiota bacterium]MCF7880142.1 T9SS type A sorting domain-containing protein [Candidatus Neomarinimicrobiota bacterium]